MSFADDMIDESLYGDDADFDDTLDSMDLKRGTGTQKVLLTGLIPAYVKVEIPEDTDPENHADVAREIFNESPREHVVCAYSGASAIGDPKDFELSNPS